MVFSGETGERIRPVIMLPLSDVARDAGIELGANRNQVTHVRPQGGVYRTEQHLADIHVQAASEPRQLQHPRETPAFHRLEKAAVEICHEGK